MTTETMAKKTASELNKKGNWVWKSEYDYQKQVFTVGVQFARTVRAGTVSEDVIKHQYRALLLEQLKDYDLSEKEVALNIVISGDKEMYYLAAHIILQQQAELHHGIIISSPTSTEGSTTTRIGASAQIISIITGLPTMNMHRDGKAKSDYEKHMLSQIKNNSIIFITGHGSPFAEVIHAEYIITDGEKKSPLKFKWDLKAYCDLIMENSSLKVNDFITIVLWSCYGGHGESASMAAKLAVFFNQQGINVRVLSSDTPVRRLRGEVSENIPFIVEGGYENIRIYDSWIDEPQKMTLSMVSKDIIISRQPLTLPIYSSTILAISLQDQMRKLPYSLKCTVEEVPSRLVESLFVITNIQDDTDRGGITFDFYFKNNHEGLSKSTLKLEDGPNSERLLCLDKGQCKVISEDDSDLYMLLMKYATGVFLNPSATQQAGMNHRFFQSDTTSTTSTGPSHAPS